MKNILRLVMLVLLTGCGNADSDSNTSEDAGNNPCPEQARADEMRINVVRSDAKQMNDLTATFLFAGGEQEWKCSSATLDGILCQAMPNMITIIVPVGTAGEIESVDLADPSGFTYSGELIFEWSDLPVSYGCSNTYRRGVFDVTLAQ